MFLPLVPAHAAPAHVAAVSHPERYVVRSGDALSLIAKRHYHDAAAWACVYDANKKVVSNPALITPGEVLVLPVHVSSHCAVPAVHQEAVLTSSVTPDRPSQPVSEPVEPSQPVPTGTYTGSTAMQECIISRESGGDPDIWNASGHWGLYQFSESTWVAHGGSPADFGTASIAEQNQIFYNAVAEDGYSDWAPYDGCTA